MNRHDQKKRTRYRGRVRPGHLAAAIAFLIGFALLAALVEYSQAFIGWDKLLFDKMSKDLDSSLELLLRDFSAFGSTVAVVTISMLYCLVSIITKKYHYLSSYLVLIISTGVGIFLTKQLFHRPRPEGQVLILSEGYAPAFPSGHVVIAVVMYITLSLVAGQTLKGRRTLLIFYILALAWIFVIAIARVSLKYHYPADCLGGALFGLGLLHLYVGLGFWPRLHNENE